MASRRSRLQIKPNIGGPKVAPRPAAKKSVSASKTENVENKTVPSTSTDKVQPVEKDVREPKNDDHITKTNTSLEKETEKTETDAKDPDKRLISSEEHQQKGNSGLEDNDGIGSLPLRTNIRRFDKVNIGAASSKTKDIPDTDVGAEKIIENESTPEKDKSSLTLVSKDGESVKASDKESSSPEKKAPVSIPRRSRFPKAKPNVIDASRRKQNKDTGSKNDAPQKDSPAISSQPEAVSKPEIRVSIPEPSESVTYDSSAAKASSSDPGPFIPPPADNFTLISPKPSSTLPPKSPLKPPVPNIAGASPVKPVTSEKRARLFSQSESNVVKRAKKPKVDVPTDKPPDRTTMKMRDLIRWNPSSNPMKIKEKASVQKVVTNVEKENVADGPSREEDVAMDTTVEDEDNALPVPQVTIGPDGEIVVNEKSLVVKGPSAEKVNSLMMDAIDETDLITTYSSFRKQNRSRPWSDKATAKFYKALAMIGIDFFLIGQLFPKRTRTEIKKKFQKEERINRELVEKVLRERIKFDATVFDKNKEDGGTDDEIIKPKRAKKEPKKKTPKPEKPKKDPAPKSTSNAKKKRSKLYDYYEDDNAVTTDEEDGEETAKKQPHSKMDPTWQPPARVSQKDGEVVNILMDMSEGRLSEGQGQTVRKSGRPGAGILGKLRTKVSGNVTDAAPSASATSPPYSITVTQNSNQNANAGNKGNTSSQTQSSINNPNVIYTGGNVIYPVVNTTNNAALQNLQALQLQSSIPQSGGQHTATSSTSSTPGSSNQATLTTIDPGNQGVPIPASSLNVGGQTMFGVPQTIDGDQYVLVTVMPEGGGETVIHIYRLQGAMQSDGSNQPSLAQIQSVENAPQIVENIPQSLENTSQSLENTQQIVENTQQIVENTPQNVKNESAMATEAYVEVNTSATSVGVDSDNTGRNSQALEYVLGDDDTTTQNTESKDGKQPSESSIADDTTTEVLYTAVPILETADIAGDTESVVITDNVVNDNISKKSESEIDIQASETVDSNTQPSETNSNVTPALENASITQVTSPAVETDLLDQDIVENKTLKACEEGAESSFDESKSQVGLDTVLEFKALNATEEEKADIGVNSNTDIDTNSGIIENNLKNTQKRSNTGIDEDSVNTKVDTNANSGISEDSVKADTSTNECGDTSHLDTTEIENT